VLYNPKVVDREAIFSPVRRVRFSQAALPVSFDSGLQWLSSRLFQDAVSSLKAAPLGEEAAFWVF
jgi:hypothetical protein